MSTPDYARIDCNEPDCEFYIGGYVDSGFGEMAAKAMNEHAESVHNSQFPLWKRLDTNNKSDSAKP